MYVTTEGLWVALAVAALVVLGHAAALAAEAVRGLRRLRARAASEAAPAPARARLLSLPTPAPARPLSRCSSV